MAPKGLKENPSAIGDPTSLKAETSDHEPTPNDRPNKEKPLKEIAQDKLKTNPSQLGDPISLKAETSSTIPKPEEAGAKADKKKDSKL